MTTTTIPMTRPTPAPPPSQAPPATGLLGRLPPPLRRRLHPLLGLGLPLVVLLSNLIHFAPFTIDDAYISFRYARNLADGLGLVYNAGERIEGYTNFLWTALLGLGAAVGADPVLLSKLLGGACAGLTLVVAYRFAGRLLPFGRVPCVATWLLATSPLCAGYAVFGLETPLFTLLVLTGAYLVYVEADRGERAFPWSSLVFGAAALTRPEAPLFLGLTALTLGRRFVGRQNLLRGAVFVAIVAAHLLWRRAYYGEWLPATLYAKTGDLERQLRVGSRYVWGYLQYLGPIALMAPVGLAITLRRRPREALALALITALFAAYIVLVGGDWMPHHRFVAPIEPFLFLLIGAGVRRLGELRQAIVLVVLAGLAIAFFVDRNRKLNQAYDRFVVREHRAHMRTAGAAADWLEVNPPGRIAIGDIGLVGYRTNFPLLDTLGLVDPVIAKLPGGYTQKLGQPFLDRIFTVMPAYMVLIVGGNCDRPTMAGSRAIYRDRRFAPNYATAHRIGLGKSNWCIYEHRRHRDLDRAGVDPAAPRSIPLP